jgi:hypothetical protein
MELCVTNSKWRMLRLVEPQTLVHQSPIIFQRKSYYVQDDTLMTCTLRSITHISTYHRRQDQHPYYRLCCDVDVLSLHQHYSIQPRLHHLKNIKRQQGSRKNNNNNNNNNTPPPTCNTGLGAADVRYSAPTGIGSSSGNAALERSAARRATSLIDIVLRSGAGALSVRGRFTPPPVGRAGNILPLADPPLERCKREFVLSFATTNRDVPQNTFPIGLAEKAKRSAQRTTRGQLLLGLSAQQRLDIGLAETTRLLERCFTRALYLVRHFVLEHNAHYWRAASHGVVHQRVFDNVGHVGSRSSRYQISTSLMCTVAHASHTPHQQHSTTNNNEPEIDRRQRRTSAEWRRRRCADRQTTRDLDLAPLAAHVRHCLATTNCSIIGRTEHMPIRICRILPRRPLHRLLIRQEWRRVVLADLRATRHTPTHAMA